MSAQTTTGTPSIYVGTYAKYNNGSLFGEWLNLTDYSDKDEFYEACKELHDDEDDPEFMFQDWEYINDIFISECHISEKFFDHINKLEEIENENTKEAFEIYLGVFQDMRKEFFDIDSAFDDFGERYQGYFEGYNPESDFTYQFVEQTGLLNGVSDSIQTYFDYDKYKRDLFIGDYTEYSGHIFCNH